MGIKKLDKLISSSLGETHIFGGNIFNKVVSNPVPYDKGAIKYGIPYGCKKGSYVCRLNETAWKYVSPLDPLNYKENDVKITLDENYYMEPHETLFCSTIEMFYFPRVCLPTIELLPIYSNLGLLLNKTYISDFISSPHIYFSLYNPNGCKVRLYANQGIIEIFLLRTKVDMT